MKLGAFKNQKEPRCFERPLTNRIARSSTSKKTMPNTYPKEISTMTMFNPPHAGMLITDVIETKGITALELSSAMKLQD